MSKRSRVRRLKIVSLELSCGKSYKNESKLKNSFYVPRQSHEFDKIRYIRTFRTMHNR